MALTITSRTVTGGHFWEWEHNDVQYRAENRDGASADRVTLYWLHDGQPITRGVRYTRGSEPRMVAIGWAEEITGQPF